MNLLAAAGAAGSPVRKFVLKSSTLLYGSNYKDPYFFREGSPRTSTARTNVERSLVEVGAIVRDFAEDNPQIVVTKLEFANVLGRDIDSAFSRLLRRPVVPEIFGFDPRLQFVHEDDVTGALRVRDAPRRPRRVQRGGRGPAAVERGLPHRAASGASPCRPSPRSWPPRHCATRGSPTCHPSC